ncbi:hypothetical protein N779_23710 [Vibrio coralliilyticus OCN008]|nr:hypothetical protein N779_23710 [Vibrio coralliilyticus OCN008]
MEFLRCLILQVIQNFTVSSKININFSVWPYLTLLFKRKDD